LPSIIELFATPLGGYFKETSVSAFGADYLFGSKRSIFTLSGGGASLDR
jgi:hypothetical protein